MQPTSNFLIKTPEVRPHAAKTERKRRLLRRLIALIVLTAAAGAAVRGFLEGHDEMDRKTGRERPVKTNAEVAANGIILVDRAAHERSGIETARLRAAPYLDQIQAYGVVFDSTRISDLNNSYVNAEAQLRIAQSKVTFSRAAFERAQTLYGNERSDRLAALQSAEAAYRTDEANVGAAESLVRTLVATALLEWGPVLGKSLVERTQTAVRLIGRQEFLLQVTLPPGVLVRKSVISAAIESFGKGSDNGCATITLVSPAAGTDARIQGVSFFYLAPAESGVLPGMNVVAFFSSGASADGVAIPTEALVWWQDRSWAYRHTGPETFVPIQVAVDLPTPGGGFIDRNPDDEAEIVTRSTQLLLSEEFRARIQVGED
jgi:hypothetical protein